MTLSVRDGACGPAAKQRSLCALVAVALAMPMHGHAQEPTHSDHGTQTVAASDDDSAGAKDHDSMDHGKIDHGKMDHSQMEGMDHGEMDHSQMEGMGHGEMDQSKMDQGQMKSMNHDMKDMQGGSAPPGARSPDYSDGVGSGPMHGMHHMHGESVLTSVLIDHLEAFHGDEENGQAINARAWVGSDLNKLWFKLEGERSDGQLGEARSELLWNHAISAYWGLQTGVRHDFGDGPDRNWAAFGFQGLAPYWFEIDATAYVGESGRTAFRLEAEYELLLTQRSILQPDLEMNFYGEDDPARGVGAGLSDLEFGLRLRYEFTRKFAPYLGVVWSRKFGKTADYAREDDEEAEDTGLVAGVRLWF
ncbi:MAG: copper resistance protein B [Dokdonella sp.]